MVYALIFAGGVGSRMKSQDIPKQFLKVDGIPIIIRTVMYFENHSAIDRIVVVCLESWINELKKEISQYNITKVETILPGGETGYQSIHKGLMNIFNKTSDEDFVLVCDGVRPILSDSLITTCISETKIYGNAVPVVPSIDSVLYSDNGFFSKINIDRKKIFITQAPQGYKISLIKKAHLLAEQKGIEAVSSADLLLDLGMDVHLFEGLRNNIKVTTEEDLYVIRAMYYYEHFQNYSKEEQ